MYKNIEFPCVNLKKKLFNNSIIKSRCSQMEKDIFNFFNQIRQEPFQLITYLINKQQRNNKSYEIEQIINYINNLSNKSITLPALIQKKELTNISYDLLNYIINMKKSKRRIHYDLLNNCNISLKIRASPYIRIIGKYYEGIVLESHNLSHIVSYILRDIKGRNVLFNEKIKYIGIACGYLDDNINDILYNNNDSKCNICTIIDLVQDFEKIDINNPNNSYLNDKIYNCKVSKIFMKSIPFLEDNIEYQGRNLYIKNLIPKSYSFELEKKKKFKKKKAIHFIKDNTYDNIFMIKKDRSPKLNKNLKLNNYYNKEKPKSPLISLNSKINQEKEYENIKTEPNINYQNHTFYFSKYLKKDNIPEKKEEKTKTLEKISESKSISSSSFSRQRTKKKLNLEEKIELLRKINKESRDKSKKKKTALKNDDDSKSASYTTKKIDISNDNSFSELVSIDNEKKIKDEKDSRFNVSKLKSEIKKEIKNEVKEELKAELEDKFVFKNKIKTPLIKLLLNNNNNNSNNNNEIYTQNKKDYSYDLGLNIINNQNNDIKNTENFTNRSINSIDIFFPPNKNITALRDSQAIPGLININSTLLNKEPIINNKINKENGIIKKVVNLDNLKSMKKGNKTPNAIRNFNNSPYKNYKNLIYYKKPISNSNNIYCHIKKQKELLESRHNTLNVKKININFNNLNNTNILKNVYSSPRKIKEVSPLFYQKLEGKNINNDYSKITKKVINNVNYIDNNSIIINNKTNNIVYIKQNSPSQIKKYEVHGIYGKKINYIK